MMSKNQIESKFLGDGGFATVYLEKDASGKQFALKIPTLDTSEAKNKERLEMLRREIAIQKDLKHPNILSIVNFKLTDKLAKSWVGLEYADAGDLLELLINHEGKLGLDTLIPIMHHITSALVYLTEQNIVHADIKPENIMLKHKWGGAYQAKLGDFGLASRLIPGTNKEIRQKRGGSINYISPESISMGEYSYASDVFSFGAVMYTMVVGQEPYSQFSQQGVACILNIIYELNNTNNENFSPQQYLSNLNFPQPDINYLMDNLEVSFTKDVPSDLCHLIKNCLHPKSVERLPANRLQEILDDMDQTSIKQEGQVLSEVTDQSSYSSSSMDTSQYSPGLKGSNSPRFFAHLLTNSEDSRITPSNDTGDTTEKNDTFDKDVFVKGNG